MIQNKTKIIRDLGQSIWLDFFDREIMNSGKLKKMIEEDGISGVTSNPSIFEKAIRGGSDYDEDIVNLSKTKRSYEAIFFSLAVKDIRRAADLFKRVHEESNGEDAFVSLEVSPHLAHDTEGTVKQAMKLWKAVDRKNVMIKIPSTTEGLAAIRQCISEGININITLLFGLPRYKEVIDAYLSGLEDRVNTNGSIDQIASVASFFLSRIDVMIDPILRAKGLDKLKGQVAIASAKEAYEIYKKTFSSERFKILETKGAKRQRLLWASTGTKDPKASDVLYVKSLAAPFTINTMPEATLKALADHGELGSIMAADGGGCEQVLKQFAQAGINVEDLAAKLQDEGAKSFVKSWNELLGVIASKSTELRQAA